MAGTVEIQMPQMGESVTEGTVLEWHKREGEFVEEGETVVEVSTDKVDAEVPAPASGTITRILKGEDETIEVGGVLGELDPTAAPSGNGSGAEAGDEDREPGPGISMEGGGEGDADLGEGPLPELRTGTSEVEATSSAVGEAVEIQMPEMGESVAEGVILEWHKREGDPVEEGETVVEVSTDKVDAEVPAPVSGTLTKIHAQPDETVKVGQVLAEMSASHGGGHGAGAQTTERADRAPQPSAENGGEAEAPRGAVPDGRRISPVARRIAAASGVDVSAIEGSGPGGKVTKTDVLAAADGKTPARPKPAGEPPAGEVKPLRGTAAMLAKAMNESRSMPTATSFRTLPVDVLDAKRKALNGVLKDRGMKVSFTHLVAWAIVQAAIEWRVMARVYEEHDGKPHLVEPGSVNLGLAVDVERKGSRSLMVPCIKGADTLDFASFHSYYEELITKTRENELTADDFQGTNVTLTNPGGLGTVASVPRLLTGQGTIVATGSIAYPVEWAHAPADKIKALGVSKVMTMTSTYDHRIIQGAESGSFLRRIDQLLQGEDGFYESIAEALGISAAVIANAYPASASAPPLTTTAAPPAAPAAAPPDSDLLQAVQAATSLLKAYRTHGHLAARLDPLGKEPKGDPAIDPENVNLTPELMTRIPASILRIGVEGETLLEALPRMREAYCGTIAYQIEHLSSHAQRMWLREMIETGAHRSALSRDEKRALLSRLVDVFQFERFIQRAYLGQKLFSIEGLDAVVPMIDELVTLGRRAGAGEGVLGIAHPGRLSVLAHNRSRSVESILAEFEGAKALEQVKAIAAIPHAGTGDVKYHYGAEGMFTTSDGDQVKVRLYPNPSHLEFVDPVVTGGARAAQTSHSGPRLHHKPELAVPLLLHGDAAFPGQGVVAETLNLQSLAGYSTGGTVHIITDNQVRFTTNPEDARSTPYASDLAKGFNVPIIHVNADDVEACIAAIRLAMAYRERWSRDVVIDLIGYRRYGHNETDEPAYTQPTLAAQIKAHSPVSELYAAQLVSEGVVTGEDVEAMGKERRDELQRTHKELKRKMESGQYEDPTSTQVGTGELDRSKSPEVETAVSEDRLRSLNVELLKVPESFTIHRKLRKPLMRRSELLDEGPIEYGHAEALAFASLLTEGTHIRLTGQDTERGTFSHRHLALYDEKTGLKYVPIQNLAGALAAEGNMRLANPTTAAQYFHLLRRQARIRKPRPLVVFTPKGLLRLGAAASKLADLTSGGFQFVLDDPRAQERKGRIERLVLCSGKVYYDMDGHERREDATSVAIARVELLYPFAKEQIRELIASYPNVKEIVWAQEEPQNMGAWKVMARRMPELVPEDVDFRYVGRPQRASPSEGYPAAHRSEQERIVLTALT